MIQPPRPRLLLGLIGAATLLGGLLGLAALTWFDHDATMVELVADLSLSARLMETHLEGLHANAHSALLRIEEHIGDRPLASLRDSETERQWLDRVRADIPHAFAICLHDGKDDLILSTDRQGVFAPNARGREYIALAAAKPGQTVISAMITNRIVPGHFVILSRTLQDSAGRVRGTAEILIRGEFFTDFYRDLKPEPGALFTIARRDGALVARYPMPAGPALPHIDPTSPPYSEFRKEAEGTLRFTSAIDGVERMAYYRWLPDTDVAVVAGLSMESMFRDWTIRTQRNTTMFTVGILLLLILAVVTNESLRHESRLLRSVEQKAAQLSDALAEKDILFQEVHHRVKNNLQVISSLLTMQSLHVNDDVARATLKDALDRIHSMGLVHQTLYEHNVAASVDLGTYFGRLAEALAGSHQLGTGGVTIQVNVDGTLDLDRAVPLGMLANEALSNALKHAFPDGRLGTVSISLSCERDQWRFVIRDDGVGMPQRPGRGIGVGLIRALSRQLGGECSITNDNGTGTAITVTFPCVGPGGRDCTGNKVGA